MNDQVFNEHFAHQGAQRAIELTDFAACGVDLNAEEIEPFTRGVIVGLVSEETIHVLSNDHVEQLRLGCAHQALKARPVDSAPAGNLAILKRADNGHALARAHLAQECNLVFNRAVFLPVGRIAGVNGGADHGCTFIEETSVLLAAISAA
nr:hypothetical protein [Bradyrhizobium sp. SZCCHNS2005]